MKIIRILSCVSLLVVVGQLSAYDEELTDREKDLREIGDYLQFLIPAAGLGATFLYQDPVGRKQWFYHGVASVGTNSLIKGIGGKLRPDYTAEQSDVWGQSFPSGHTNAAFWGASFLGRRYGRNWGIPAYAGATFVGYSRVLGRKHFVDDVVIGASISILYSFVFVDRYDPNQKTTIKPITDATEDGTRFGVELNMRW